MCCSCRVIIPRIIELPVSVSRDFDEKGKTRNFNIFHIDENTSFDNERGNCSSILDFPHMMICASLLIISETILDATIRITDSLLWYDEAKDGTVEATPHEQHNAILCLSMRCSPTMNNHRSPGEESLSSILLMCK